MNGEMVDASFFSQLRCHNCEYIIIFGVIAICSGREAIISDPVLAERVLGPRLRLMVLHLMIYYHESLAGAVSAEDHCFIEDSE